jgi:hypothetical protein
MKQRGYVKMIERKLITTSMIIAILLVFAVQISIFGLTISSKKNVAGIVYAATGVPISGATVLASGTDGFGYTTTNVNGQFTITEGLKTGNYTVMAEKEGYVFAEVKNVAVTAPSETSGVSIYMNRSGGISGRITDAITSFGVPSISVFAMLSSGGGTYFGTAVTDVGGNFEMTMNLGTGTYNVTVMMPKGYISNTVSPVSVTEGQKTTGVNMALQRSGIISGRITTPTNEPLANITVTAYNSLNPMAGFGSDETNATGYYRIASGLGTGNFTVMAYSGISFDSAEVFVTAGQETSNVNLQLEVTPPAPSGIIMGKVTDASDGKPIVDAHVVAEGDTTVSYGDAYTDEEGNYIISEGLDTDTYTVSATASGYQDVNVTNKSVTVDQVTSNVNLQMHKIPTAQSGRISGTVTGDTNPIPEFGYPMAIMMIITLVTVFAAKSVTRKTKPY